MDVDLCDSKRDRLLDVLVADPGCSVKYQRYGYGVSDLLYDFKVQLRLRGIDAMLISDRNCQRIAACTLYELRRLRRIRILIACQRFLVYGFISYMAKLCLYRDSQWMKIIYHFFCKTDVLFKFECGSISHHGIHSMVVCVLHDLHAAAVIPVCDDRYGRLLCHGNHHMAEIFKRSISYKSGSEGNDHRRFGLFRRIHNSHEHLRVPYVEVGDGISSFCCFLFPISDIC